MSWSSWWLLVGESGSGRLRPPPLIAIGGGNRGGCIVCEVVEVRLEGEERGCVSSLVVRERIE